ncbi:MAG TPA: CAP domain-containing protein [Candidatus Obscuribacterales bacterium]
MNSAAALFARPKNLVKLGLLLGLLFQLMLPGWSFSLRSNDSDLLSLDEARQYMLSLINRDRASQGVAPVTLDEAASRAAQQHSDEMAGWGYVSHWDRQGRKPDQRYSEAGGSGAVFENVYTNHDIPFLGYRSRLAERQLFPRREIEKAQAWFFEQEAPRDGHRRNVLDPNHNKVGIGLSLAVDKNFGSRITVCQEFVNEFVTLAESPDELAPGKQSRVAGRLDSNLALHAVQICREGEPRPMTPYDLKKTSSYSLPSQAVAICYPAPYCSPLPVNLVKTSAGEEFCLVLNPDDKWQDGLYYIMVWVRKPGSKAAFLGSTKTVRFAGGSQLGTIAADVNATPGS